MLGRPKNNKKPNFLELHSAQKIPPSPTGTHTHTHTHTHTPSFK